MPDLTDAWDDIDPALPLHVRMEKLENMMRAWRDQEAAAHYLQESVERLGLNASALGEALLQVDKNQQTLTKLGKDLEKVESTSATKDDLEEAKKQQAQVTLEFRKRTLTRIYTTGLLLLLTLLSLGAVAWSYHSSKLEAQRQICESRTEQTRIIVDVLEASLVTAPPERKAQLQDAINRFNNLNADCEAL